MYQTLYTRGSFSCAEPQSDNGIMLVLREVEFSMLLDGKLKACHDRFDGIWFWRFRMTHDVLIVKKRFCESLGHEILCSYATLRLIDCICQLTFLLLSGCQPCMRVIMPCLASTGTVREFNASRTGRDGWQQSYCWLQLTDVWKCAKKHVTVRHDATPVISSKCFVSADGFRA